MRALAAIAGREARAFFRLPLGWVVIALYLFLTGLVLVGRTLVPGEPASLRDFFGTSGSLLLLIMPAVSMRLLAEEKRSGTIEPLLTAPVPDFVVVLGKFAGALLFLVAMLLPTLVYPGVLLAISDPPPDPGPIAAGYLSLLLIAVLSLSVGTLASALTSSQTLAFLGAFLFLLIVLLLGDQVGSLPPGVQPLVRAIAIGPRLADFAKGIVSTAHVVFFVTAAAWFLLLAGVALQSRRWR